MTGGPAIGRALAVEGLKFFSPQPAGVFEFRAVATASRRTVSMAWPR